MHHYLKVITLDCRNVFRISLRNASGWKQTIMKEEEMKKIVFQYASQNTKRTERIYGWGYSGTGALGVKTFIRPEKHQSPRNRTLVPNRLSFFDEFNLKVHDVSCGYGYTVFACVTDAGVHEVYGTGLNTDSQVGFHEFPRNSGRVLDYVIQPARIHLPAIEAEDSKLSAVACGRAHTVILMANSQLFTVGNNANGQCARRIIKDEDHRGSKLVYKVPFTKKIKQIVCGADHTIILTEEGEVYSCGFGGDGQTGLGHLKCCGELTRVVGDIVGEKIMQVSCRVDCVLAVSEKGDVFGWGNSEYDQLYAANQETSGLHTSRRLLFSTDVGKVHKVASGGSMCSLLNANGQVFTWGYGILGKGPRVQESKEPLLIPEILFGRSDVNSDCRVIDIQAGVKYLTAITNHGDLFVWGKNDSGCLGLGHKLDQMFPYKTQLPAEVRKVSCGIDHTMALCRSIV